MAAARLNAEASDEQFHISLQLEEYFSQLRHIQILDAVTENIIVS
jgi:hypothetical protein